MNKHFWVRPGTIFSFWYTKIAVSLLLFASLPALLG